MIQVQTLLHVADNSGGRFVRCLKILKKGTKPQYGQVGDIIVVSIKQLRTQNKFLSKVKKGEVLLAVIVKTHNVFKRPIGFSFNFSHNAVVLVNKQFKPLATRIIGLIPRELKNKKFSKIVSLSAGTL